MAINKNHEFEELNGIKCGIVEKNVSMERSAFLKNILEQNGYEVVIVEAAPPKAKAAPKTEATEEVKIEVVEEVKDLASLLYTIGVSDYTFNTINALYGRMLKTKNGKIVTPAYWYEKEETSQDEIPYFDKKY